MPPLRCMCYRNGSMRNSNASKTAQLYAAAQDSLRQTANRPAGGRAVQRWPVGSAAVGGLGVQNGAPFYTLLNTPYVLNICDGFASFTVVVALPGRGPSSISVGIVRVESGSLVDPAGSYTCYPWWGRGGGHLHTQGRLGRGIGSECLLGGITLTKEAF